MNTAHEPKDEMMKFLKTHAIGHFTTLTADGKPYASTVYYYINSMMDIFIITLEETDKYKNIRKNSDVALVITDDESLQTVQIQGNATEVVDPAIRMAIVEQLAIIQARSKSSWPPPITKLNKGKLHLIKVTPSWIRFSDFKAENVIRFEA